MQTGQELDPRTRLKLLKVPEEACRSARDWRLCGKAGKEDKERVQGGGSSRREGGRAGAGRRDCLLVSGSRVQVRDPWGSGSHFGSRGSD